MIQMLRRIRRQDRRYRQGRTRTAAIATLVFALAGANAHADTLTDWQAAPIGMNAYVTNVAFVAGDRVYAGYSLHPFTFAIDAKVYTASGIPGTLPVIETDLGFNTLTSITTGIAARPTNGYYLTVQQNQLNGEIRSYIMVSQNLGNPIAISGPAPANDPDVALNGINGTGLAIGDTAANFPLVATPSGFSLHLNYLTPTALSAISSDGTRVSGELELVGGTRVAIVGDPNSLLFYESTDSISWDIEGIHVVGSRDGFVAWWIDVGGIYQPRELKDLFGNPIPGGLLCIDSAGSGFAGGYLDDGRAIVVNLHTGEWFDVAMQMGMATGSLSAIVALEIENGLMAMAAEGADLSGWDLTALVVIDQPVPGPGPLLIPALLAVGGLALRRRRDAQRG